ncbi:MAG: UTP--glucose-1-phosphate uridylyltransferase [Myxococcota bacterium]
MNLDETTRGILQRFGFDEETFAILRDRLQAGAAGETSNIIQGEVLPPHKEDVRPLPNLGTEERKKLAEIGQEAISAGQVGAVVLAGGMATRFGGVVKAGVPAIDDRSFLELKLRDLQKSSRVPVYLMTSFATNDVVDDLAAPFRADGRIVETFPQFVSLRLTPDGDIFRGAGGTPSLYAPGHGDLTFALRKAGILERFRAAGGRLLFMSNVDNLTATLDPAIVGAHLEHGRAFTAEVAPKMPGDKGGAPARVDDVPQIVEGFRFPPAFDQDRIPVFNTNTLILDAEAIDRDFDLSWFAVRKKVDDQPVVQFEHLVGQLSAFLPSSFVRVEREGPDARFQPVKDPAELERRKPEIRSALEGRGVL